MNPACLADAMRAATAGYLGAKAAAEAFGEASLDTDPDAYGPESDAFEAVSGALWSLADAAARSVVRIILVSAGADVRGDGRGNRVHPPHAVEFGGRLWIARPETDDVSGRPGPDDGPMRLDVVPLDRLARL